MVERTDEPLALLGRRGAPVLTEHQARRKLRVEMRQQVFVDEVPDLRGVAPVGIAILVQVPKHALRGGLHHLRGSVAARRAGGGGSGGGNGGDRAALRGRRTLRLRDSKAARQPQPAHENNCSCHFLGSTFWLSVLWLSL